MPYEFSTPVTDEAELRAMLGESSEIVKRKQLDALDVHCRAFIALSPMLLLATHDAAGACDVSPRGDAAGFVRVLDDRTLVIPDRPGNRRIDSMRNILQTGRAGLLFLIPGVEETLRVNGTAAVVRDPALLQGMAVAGKVPQVAIAVSVTDCFMHCAKALKRSRLWDHETWPSRDALPSLAAMLKDQTGLDMTLAEFEAHLAESYAKRLY